MAKWKALVLAALTLASCAKNQNSDPEVFLPKQVGADGSDIESIRVRQCHGRNVTIEGDVLTHENFKAVFNCANYDGSLEPLNRLVTSPEFPSFLTNINAILKAEGSEGIRETLRGWLAEGREGTSRADRLLPVLQSVIKNASFQDALPLIASLLENGESVWNELLPSLADVLYTERFANNFDDIFKLFQNPNGDENYSKTVKDWAKFLKTEIDDKTVAQLGLELADDVRNLRMKDTTLQEYLDNMNVNGVFVSLFMENGAVRGEKTDDKLNEKPDPWEDATNPPANAEERRIRNYQRLYARGANGEQAPIMQLLALVDEFQKPHQDFVPAFGRWFSANGNKLARSLSEYVVRARVLEGLGSMRIAKFLNDFADENDFDTTEPLEAEKFVEFLQKAFADSSFADWAATNVAKVSAANLGEKNAKILEGSNLTKNVVGLYQAPEVSAYGKAIYELESPPETLDDAIRKFSNLHRREVQLTVGKTADKLEAQLINAWWEAANEVLGENVVVDFALPLLQTVVKTVTESFGKDTRTISEWYFSSPYSDPGTTQSLAGYAFLDFNLLDKYHANYDYLMNKLPEEIFRGPNAEQNVANKRAYRALLAQLPNIWMYWKSGMSRSGNDLTRAMASKGKGFLIRNYVALLVNAYGNGFAEKFITLLSAYQQAFPSSLATQEVSDALEDRRPVSRGADALKRVLDSLFEPEQKGNYNTSTLGRLLVPVSSLVAPAKREATTRFVLTSAEELLKTPDEKLNDFFRDFSKEAKPNDAKITQRQETMRAVSDAMKKPEFPTVVRQLNTFFRDNAVKPALDYLVAKIDDGTLQDVIRFLGRVLGYRSR